MKNLHIIIVFALVFSNASYAFAQESTRGTNLYIAPTSRTETTVVTPDPVRVTLPSQEQPPVTVVVPSSEANTCTKSARGQCTIFSCADGTSVNTCDLTCKEVPPKSSGDQVIKPSNTQEVVKSSDSAVVVEGVPKIIKVTPDAAYVGSAVPIGVDFFPGANFKGYDTAIIGDVVVDFYIGDTGSKNPDGSINGTFWVPAGISAGPSSLILMNKKMPKSALTWSEKFVVTPGGDAQSIVSVTPSHGKAGDVIVVKIAMGKKAYTKGGFITINGQNNEFVSSTFDTRTKNGGVYTMTYKLLPGNASGVVKLISAAEFPEVVSDTYFTVDKPGVITSFFNYIGGFFK